MKRAAKIAISLPEDLLHDIEEQRRASGQTRSEFFRRVTEAFLRRQREQEAVQRYIEGYRRYPETAEEIALSETTSREAFADNPWEDEPGP